MCVRACVCVCVCVCVSINFVYACASMCVCVCQCLCVCVCARMHLRMCVLFLSFIDPLRDWLGDTYHGSKFTVREDCRTLETGIEFDAFGVHSGVTTSCQVLDKLSS